MSNTTDLIVTPGTPPAAVVPTETPGVAAARQWLMPPGNLTEAMALAKVLADSSFVPRDFKGKPGDVLCAIQYGAEIGLPPLQALQGVAVVNGRPAVWGDAALAIVLASGTVEDLEETVTGEGEAMVARFSARRAGRATPIVQAFSVADAKAAGLWKKQGPWTTNPRRMLQMRARAFGLRDGWADYLKGLSVREEAQDIEPSAPPAPGSVVELPRPVATAPTALTEEQRKALFAACRETGWTHDDLKAKLAALGIASTAEIPPDQYGTILAWAKDEPADTPSDHDGQAA